MSEKNESIAQKIVSSIIINDAHESSISLVRKIKEALDSKDSESAQLRGEVERLKDSMTLTASGIDSIKIQNASQSLLIEKLREVGTANDNHTKRIRND